MHGAGEQQQYHYARNDEQPSTSSQQHPVAHQMHQLAPHSLQGSVMRTPTMSASSTTPTTSRANLVRIGEPIKIGDNILQPAGTLVFSQGSGTAWPAGQRVLVTANKHAVVQANLFPIGTAPVITLQTSSTPNWYVNQSVTTTSNSNNSNTVTASSATPDSGIQSIPTSPPSPSYAMSHEQGYEEEEDDEPADFTDMPKLKPVDEDDCYDSPSTSMGVNFTDDNSTPTTTTAMNAVPSTSSAPPKEDLGGLDAEEFVSVSLSNNMSLDEIVKRLMKFDKSKASNIASMLKKLCAEEAKTPKKKKEMEAEVSSTTPTTPRSRGTRKRTKCTRNTNSPDVTTSTNILEEPSTSTSAEDLEAKTERKKRGRKPKKRTMENEEEGVGEEDVKKGKQHTSPELASTPEPTSSFRPQSAMTTAANPVQFRMRIHEMMGRQLEHLTQQMSTEMTKMRAVTNKSVIGGKRKESFFRQLAEQSKKLKKGQFGKRMRMFMTEEEIRLEEEESKPKDVQEVREEDVPKIRSRLPSRRTRVDESPEVLFDVEGKFNGEYYEIPKSVPSSDVVIPLWKAPNLTCGCTKGACTSDMDCLNRAMRVQCNSDCTLPYCANRRFWKEDNSKLCVSTGPRTKRVLKTKVARRAGDFLCEYAGEVITSDEAVKRFEGSEDNRIVAISSQLFVDATVRANLARFVKHSCKPNSRMEVWSVNGLYRTGIFALIDLGANVEITVDKSGLIPARRPCHCGVTGCKKVIRGVKRAVMSNEDEDVKSSLFLGRNYRKAMRNARRSSLPSILSVEEPSGSVNSVLQMKKVLAAFSFRVRNVDGTLERPMIPYYSSACRFLKQSEPDPAEFIGLIRKWLTVIDDDDVERAFVAIVSHYLSPSLLTSAKKPKENAPRARAPSTSCQSPVPSKRPDADLSYLEGQHAIGSYDPDEAWNTYKANASDNAVRCVCGALDEDGDMVQCDQCHFWLHIDCCTYDSTKNSEEYTCDFCVGNHSTHSPSADVILKTDLDVRFSNCDYYRSLVNRRGIQVRLNETVYVNINAPQDHKALLRNLKEEKKGVKHSKEFDKSLWPQAPSDKIPPREFNRKEARVFRVERLFVCPGNNRFVFGFYYIHPHETFADSGRVFSKKEVFATPYYETLPLDEVIGRCLVVDSATWSKGRPKVPKFKEDDVFLCEMQVGKNKRVFEKVPPKNRYPINTQPYVFTKFSQPKKVVRNFRPYDPANQPPKPPKTPTVQHQSPSGSAPSTQSTSPSDPNKRSQKNINTVLERLRAFRKQKQ